MASTAPTSGFTQTATSVASVSKGSLWTGRVIGTLLVLFLAFDGVMKVMRARPVLESFTRLGYHESVAVGLGILLLACTAVYAIPRTSVLGAILLTGYLGGATATHLRAGEPFYFPIVFGVLAWGALFLRDVRLRTLIPLRN